MVFELRQYTLHPGRRDELIELFEREFIEPQEDLGINLIGLFRDAANPDRFVWIRGFADMEVRRKALETFYAGPTWKQHRDAANATMLDSDNVLLLRPVLGDAAATSAAFRGPLLAATYLFSSEPDAASFAQRAAGKLDEAVRRDGGAIVALLTTEHSSNTFPQLPVRQGERAVVLLLDGIEPERLFLHDPAPREVAHLVPTPRSKIQLTRRGSPGDFAFLNGQWKVIHRKLRSRLTRCSEWIVLNGTCRGFVLADGVISVDEFEFPGGVKGCSLRNFDREAQRWSIHWTTNLTGRLFAPVHGGFEGDRGEFYGYDVEAGTPVLARYIWSHCKTKQPRWEQAFSTDGGCSWETNWEMEFRQT